MTNAAARRRYWARSMLGWERFQSAQPNPAHHALEQLEHTGIANGVITQNVDGLHRAAGSSRVVELHGALARVKCLACGQIEARAGLQRRLIELNPGWLERGSDVLPDGDAEIADEFVTEFRSAECLHCGGTLKPDVVFFGESVPALTVQSAFALLDDAQALLVIGSSLAVYSGFRFVRRAVAKQLPIALLNLGPTRADALATAKLDAPAGVALPKLVQALTAAR
jgi:NAD-dependent SIR2 family protein deacetylase